MLLCSCLIVDAESQPSDSGHPPIRLTVALRVLCVGAPSATFCKWFIFVQRQA